MNKKIKIAIATLCIASVMAIGGSLAYFTDSQSKTNLVTIGHVRGDLIEDTTDDNATKTDDGIEYNDPVTPGDVLSKAPYIQLKETSSDAYARMSVEVVALKDGEQVEGLEDQLKEIQFDIDTANWSLGTDGYYYYNMILSNDTDPKTTYLFSEVTFPTSWTNEMADLQIQIKVHGEIIQSDNFTPTTDASGSIVSWGDVNIETTH